MVLGKSRQAHQRTIMHSNTRQALNASTRSVYAKWYWVNHGRLTSERQAHQRTQSLPSATHRHSSITLPCCSSAQAPSFLSFTRAHQRTIMHSNTRQAANNHALEHSTGSERVDAFGLREMVLGKSRQAHQRTAGSPANAKITFRYPSSLINHSTLLLERSSAKLLVFYASTRSRRAVEVIICMITRDFSVISIDVTGVSLSLSLLLTKVTHAQYRKRFRVSYNRRTSHDLFGDPTPFFPGSRQRLQDRVKHISAGWNGKEVRSVQSC